MSEPTDEPGPSRVRFTAEVRNHLQSGSDTTPDILDQFERLAGALRDGSGGELRVPKAGAGPIQGTSARHPLSVMTRVFRHCTTIRHAVLCEEFVGTTNSRYGFGSLLYARAILESCAATAYNFREITGAARRFVDGPGEIGGVGAALLKAIAASRFDWSRASPLNDARRSLLEEYEASVKGPAIQDAVNVLTMLEVLREEVGKVAPRSASLVGYAYGLMSDMCHPAVGGSLLFADSREQKLTISRDYYERLGWGMVGEVLPAIVVCLGVSAEKLSRLEGFEEWGD